MSQSPQQHKAETRGSAKARRTTALLATALVAGMVALAYASVPLYQLFCQVTGFGGTTQRAEAAPEEISDRKIVVRFNSNVARDMGWRFKPGQREVTVNLGEQKLAFYQARNITSDTITGTATFNVTPVKAGIYFSKIDCFCFTEQTLAAGEEVEMPVAFFVDPELARDPDMDDVKEITLSYTFFRVKSDKLAARGDINAARGQQNEGIN